MKCKKCNSQNLIVKEEYFKNGSGPHRRLICADCLAFQKFMKKTEAKNLEIVRNITNEELNFKLDLILAHLDIEITAP